MMKKINLDTDHLDDPNYKMSHEEIAHYISQRVYNPCRTYGDFALQLFVEKTVLPDDCNSYSGDEMRVYILDFLNSCNYLKDGI
jgi:hypothetical protein